MARIYTHSFRPGSIHRNKKGIWQWGSLPDTCYQAYLPNGERLSFSRHNEAAWECLDVRFDKNGEMRFNPAPTFRDERAAAMWVATGVVADKRLHKWYDDRVPYGQRSPLPKSNYLVPKELRTGGAV